jgi:hypothetical protein
VVTDKRQLKTLHKTIKKVADDIENSSIPQFRNSWFALMSYLLMPLESDSWAFGDSDFALHHILSRNYGRY